MQDPADFDLLKGRNAERDHPPTAGPPGRWVVIVAALVLVALVGGYFLFRSTDQEPVPSSVAPPAAEPAPDPVGPLGGEPMPGAVPPLDESDQFVRELIRHLSSHPRIAAWLATDNLIRNFTVSVTNIANGRTPARHLPAMRPASGFVVQGRGGDLRIDPRSYERYDDLAQAVDSVNASGTAEIYATLKPRIEEAHRELGTQESFDATLHRAMVHLLQTPTPEEPVRLRPEGIGYEFADPRLESLSPAQKQLLRMGPRNAEIVKEKLREIALELGVPPSRLPPG